VCQFHRIGARAALQEMCARRIRRLRMRWVALRGIEMPFPEIAVAGADVCYGYIRADFGMFAACPIRRQCQQGTSLCSRPKPLG
jgi:hypothetical protein